MAVLKQEEVRGGRSHGRQWLRLPGRTAIGPVFATASFVIQIWAFLNLLRAVPALRLRLLLWDLLGTMAYVQAFALIETLLVLALLLTVVWLLPGRFWREQFAGWGTGVILLSALWAVGLHVDPQPLLDWPAAKAWGLGGAYFGSLLLLTLALWRWSPPGRLLASLGRGLQVLALIYAGLGVISLLLVLWRNV